LELSELKALVGEILELRFVDGYAAIVRLLAVTEEHHDSDFVYDVPDVLDWGPIDPRTVDRNEVHTAASRELVSVQRSPEQANPSRPSA
jgi:hypothetical protein